jgi:tRNA-2-methylthio-N6-dimethylallyladenosine synthase
MIKEDKTQRAHVVTFGCQMNKHDSEIVEGLLQEAGYEISPVLDAADVVLFHTCCVRENAEHRLYSRISQLKNLKKARPDMILGIGGCVAQKEKDALAKRFPHVDIIFGTNAISDIVSLVERADSGERPVVATPDEGPEPRSDLAGDRRDNRIHAWISIMRGCNNFCSYCIVPYVRGPQRSKRQEEVVEEATALTEQGVVEITLLGQNVNSYGHDLDSKITFPRLLESLDEIPLLRRLRFTTSHPKDLSPELMRAIRDLPTVCEHIHLPVQSGSTRILKLMKRGYSSDEYLEKIELLRATVPAINITTDVIVGFPGETEEDFDQTRLLLERARFDGAYIFKFSPRSGTSAEDLVGCVDQNTIVHRHRTLLDYQKEISLEKLEGLVGTTQSIMADSIDKKRNGYLLGRTRGYRVVSLQGDANLIGKEVNARIVRLDGWTLIGKAEALAPATASE